MGASRITSNSQREKAGGRTAVLLEWTPPFFGVRRMSECQLAMLPACMTKAAREDRDDWFGSGQERVSGSRRRRARLRRLLRRQLKRNQLAPFFARVDPSLIGIEACGGAHHWAAKLTVSGYRVKMMALQSSSRTSRPTRMTHSMRRQSARPSPDRTCDLFRRSYPSSSLCWRCTRPVRVSSTHAVLTQTRTAGCCSSSDSSFPKVSIMSTRGFQS